jgi:glycogen debranching enzyme
MIGPGAPCRKELRIAIFFLLACSNVFVCCMTLAAQTKQPLELSRPVRPWEFISALGTRAAILGREQGTFEAWAYPLKILSDFHLRFHVDGTVIPAESLARTLIVHPESTTIVYAGDTFSVRETLFVPVHEPGVIIALQITSAKPIQMEAVFRRDFQLEWPGHIDDSGEEWNPSLHAFHFADLDGKYEAMIGSPAALKTAEEYSSNYFDSDEDSLLLEPTLSGTETKIIAIAASFTGNKDLTSLYQHLSQEYPTLLHESVSLYEGYLAHTVNIHVPDEQIEKAYDWARVSVAQSVVQNPFLGQGLVAGFAESHNDYRPGFAWFFGRDAEWTSLALTAEGDFANARSALEFLSKFQRSDGKIPHEISQSASLMDWTKMPFAFASADATPLYIIAADDYVTRSGDIDFARGKWESLWNAYTFLKSTYNAQGLAQNAGIGHGWIEGGPLYPIQTELYQAALGIEAARGLSHLARVLGKEDTARDLEQVYDRERPILDDTFWVPDKDYYAYALDSNNHRIDIPSVLAAVPMWFHLLDENHAQAMIHELAGPDHQADWGMRIISSHDPKYDPSGYHFGSVWPLFTGWASVGEYNYHRALPAYSNLRANALLALDGSLGHVAEVLSGDYYQTLSTASPNQVWSAAMTANSLLTGLMGLKTDAANCHVVFTPHVPADWNSFSIDHLSVSGQSIGISYRRTADLIGMEIRSDGTKPCTMEFSPAVSLRAKVKQVRLNGRVLPFHLNPSSSDQHVAIEAQIQSGVNKIEIDIRDNFELSYASTLPALGADSRGLRVLSESWSPTRDKLTLQLSGAAEENYELSAWNVQELVSIEGAQLEKVSASSAKVHVHLPAGFTGKDPETDVVFHFARE